MVILATLFTYFTMKFGLQMHLKIADKTLCPEFYKGYCNFIPTIKDVVINCLFKPFVLSSDYVGPFWTIKYELFGYFLVLFTYYMLRGSRYRRVCVLILCLLAYLNVKVTIYGSVSINFDEYYLEFFLGALVADVFYDRNEDSGLLPSFYNKFIYNKKFICLLAAVGTYFVCCPIYFATIYSWMIKLRISSATVRGLGWAMIIYFLLNTPTFQKIFEHPVLQKLWKLSFAIYAFHWPIMLVVQAWLFSVFYSYFSYNVAAILSFSLTLPVIYLISLEVAKIEERIRQYMTI